jgi:S1-C subfamily serine protease
MKIARKFAEAILGVAVVIVTPALGVNEAHAETLLTPFSNPVILHLNYLMGAVLGPAVGGGVAVTQVDPGGLADSSGIEVGDLLVSGNGRAINSPLDVINIMDDAKVNYNGLITFTVKDVRGSGFVNLGVQV